MIFVLPFALLACVAPVPPPASETPPSDSGTVSSSATSTTADTGADDGTCPALVRTTYARCVETSAALSPGTGDTNLVGRGVVTETGAGLTGVPGAAVQGFETCASSMHQVRLVDDLGDTWSFGWDLGADTPASAAALTPGATLDFVVRNQLYWGAFVLSDATGPLLLLEDIALLETEQRGGMMVAIRADLACDFEADGQGYTGRPVDFTGTGGAVQLWAGGSAAVPLVGRTQHVQLGDCSMWNNPDSALRCGWAAWPDGP